MRNAISIDLEDWFHPEALRGVVRRDDWPCLESRARRNVERLLRVLAVSRTRATFFVLGWVAEREPGLVARLAADGHEVASHGYAHDMITHQSRDEFTADLRRSLRVLRAQSGQPVTGYRAPSFSVVRSTRWALDVLLDHGLRYDSSIFPVHHDRYGIPGAPRHPHVVLRHEERELWELPPATLRLLGHTLPAAGGGYFRLFPYAWSALALRRLNDAGVPGVVYTHPWEYDVEQPRVRLPRLGAWRHYGGIAGCEAKLERLLGEFSFTTCAEVLDAAGAPAPLELVPA